jgi:predicted Zn-ribbon and HTH transcriptional regulator
VSACATAVTVETESGCWRKRLLLGRGGSENKIVRKIDWMRGLRDICSCEHASTVLKIFRQAETATASSPASAGVKSMAEASSKLREILERIRSNTDQALTLLADSREQRALAWHCTGCGYVKHFTKPVPFEVVARCPRCKSDQFRALK